MGSNVKLIKVDNRYADIRIPLRDTKNYFVSFLGSYSTVYADFEKTPVAVTEADIASLTKNITAGNITAMTVPLKSVQITGTIQGQGGTTSGTLAPAKGNTFTTTTGTLMATSVPLNRSGSSTPVKFTGTAGDGKGLKIDMKCQNCTVDFK